MSVERINPQFARPVVKLTGDDLDKVIAAVPQIRNAVDMTKHVPESLCVEATAWDTCLSRVLELN
jgi:hypothetical protein